MSIDEIHACRLHDKPLRYAAGLDITIRVVVQGEIRKPRGPTAENANATPRGGGADGSRDAAWTTISPLLLGR
ncbi:MAG: hypothetical protein NT154_17005, partial [Verrucomicrobia bacterium]|nr:hypothetical protein [Verrucomicrobiota bacterium]